MIAQLLAKGIQGDHSFWRKAPGVDLKPEQWKWVGSRVWHCFYPNGVIYEQRFERGLIVGGFHRIKGGENRMDVYVLTADDNKWETVTAEVEPPPYVEPPTDKAALDNWPYK